MINDKLIITGYIKIETGLHIGGSDAFSAIGEADSEIIKDIMGNPIIPGSSLKGKMRSLLARKEANMPNKIEIKNDSKEIIRLFGGNIKDGYNKKTVTARFIFRDCKYNPDKSFKTKFTNKNIPIEVKVENNINRLTSKATPRSLERVPAGNFFDFELIYNLENKEEFKKDMEMLKDGLSLLELDYLGGNGTRGYGKIKFDEIMVESFNDCDENIKICNDILN